MRRTFPLLLDVVVVESPAKVKPIQGYLDKSEANRWKVVSTRGHVTKMVSIDPIQLKGCFTFSDEKVPLLKTIPTLAQKGKKGKVFLATDPDREGECIAQDIATYLKSGGKKGPEVCRISFNEVTEKAVLESLQQQRKVNKHLVDAGVARKIIDWWFGIAASRFLRNHNRECISAGRVQSPALSLVADRTKDQVDFVPESFFNLSVLFKYAGAECSANVTLGKTSRLSVSETEALTKLVSKSPEFRATATEKVLQGSTPAYFDTAACLKECSKELKMRISEVTEELQGLFVKGYVTYIRTDSTTISSEAAGAIRQYIEKRYGKSNVLETSPAKPKKGKLAQEAHEAIRPTNIALESVPDIGPKAAAVYDMIRRRTLAATMQPPSYNARSLKLTHPKPLGGKTVTATTQAKVLRSPGYLVVTSPNKASEVRKQISKDDVTKVQVKVGKLAEVTTKPPSDLTSSELVESLKKHGIGRPSTYSSILLTMTDRRNYLSEVNNVLKITEAGAVANDFMSSTFPNWVDYKYTAKLEADLDKIAKGKLKKDEFLRTFREQFSRDVSAVKSSKARFLGVDPETRLNYWCKFDSRAGGKIACLGDVGEYPFYRIQSQGVPGLEEVARHLKANPTYPNTKCDFTA